MKAKINSIVAPADNGMLYQYDIGIIVDIRKLKNMFSGYTVFYQVMIDEYGSTVEYFSDEVIIIGEL